MASTLKEAIDFKDNKEVCVELSRTVIEQFIHKKGLYGDMRRGLLEVNDFSVCFGIDVHGASKYTGIFVKIPKANLVFKKKKTIMPLTDEDRKFAEAEYNSLTHLVQYWQSEDIKINIIKPLGYLKDFNAIVTERVYGEDFFKLFRKVDILNKFYNNGSNNHVHNSLFNLGMALSRFHKTSLKECVIRIDEISKNIERYCSQLKFFGVSHNFLDSVIEIFCRFQRYSAPTHLTNTLKGLDIRNLIIDKTGKLFLLDPGKLKKYYKEADLARFMITCRILYWGSSLFFLRISPEHTYEKSFAEGYYNNNEKSEATLLKLFLIKELFKHWHMAHTALHLKSWPFILKRFLKYAYIDPFYKKQIGSELSNLRK